MKIIILGAGQVGGTLAENLASEANDITVVDTDIGRLRSCRTASISAPLKVKPPIRVFWNRPVPGTQTC